MIKVGIVGSNGCKDYADLITGHQGFLLTGVFDPGFQTELVSAQHPYHIYYSFDEFLCNCHAIIFATTDKLVLPLVSSALRASKQIYLKGCHEFLADELRDIVKLHHEANEVLQVQNKYYFHPAIQCAAKCFKSGSIIEIHKSVTRIQQLMPELRAQVTMVLLLQKSNIKRVVVNSSTVFNQMPDVINLRLDFDNGAVAKILVSAADFDNFHTLKAYGYNQVHAIDFILAQHAHYNGIEKNNHIYPFEKSNQLTLLQGQINAFYHHIINFNTPECSVQVELAAQMVIDKVKERLKICFSFF
jgi:predicted dehydrogenase